MGILGQASWRRGAQGYQATLCTELAKPLVKLYSSGELVPALPGLLSSPGSVVPLLPSFSFNHLLLQHPLLFGSLLLPSSLLQTLLPVQGPPGSGTGESPALGI